MRSSIEVEYRIEYEIISGVGIGKTTGRMVREM